MMKFTSASLAALTAFGIATTAMTPAAEARRGVGIAAGVVLGLTAAAIAANAAHASPYEHRRWRSRCDDLADRCNRGFDRACYRFEQSCR